MPIDSLLGDALELMVLGMGTVFVILTLMVGLITGSSRLLGRYFPEQEHTDASATARGAKAKDHELIAVIQAAIHRFRASS